MSNVTVKPKKLWGNPKVAIDADNLIIDERYYSLAQTFGAYVEPAPEAPKPEKTETKEDNRSTFRKVILGIWIVIVIIFVLIFVAWWNDGFDTYGSGGQSKNHQLVLISNNGPVIVLQHTNQKKLKKIAAQVNAVLVGKGITPQTGYTQASNDAKVI